MVWVAAFRGCALFGTTIPAARQDYFQRLLAIREDAQVKRIAQRRAGDPDLAEDALQETYYTMACIKDPSGIENLRAYFCRVLIRTVNALRGQLGAILPDDLTAVADAGQGQARDRVLPRPVDELAAESLDARGWLGRFAAERESLAARVPCRA